MKCGKFSQVDSSDLLRMIYISTHKHTFTFRDIFGGITETYIDLLEN